MRITALIAGLILLAVTPANAVFVGFDSEPNNTRPLADPLVSDDLDFDGSSCALSADVGMGSLAAGPVGDLDHYSVFLPNGCIITAITTPLAVFGSSPDTLLGLYDAIGLANLNDDAGDDWDTSGPLTVRGSAIRYQNVSGAGMFVEMVVSGYPDFAIDGSHGETGSYLLTVSVTPEPATIGLLVGGLLLGLRRRVR